MQCVEKTRLGRNPLQSKKIQNKVAVKRDVKEGKCGGMQESQSTLPTLQFKAGTPNNTADNITASLHQRNAIDVTQDNSISTVTKNLVK